MNFCVVPREIREINKRGGQNSLSCGRVSKNHEKNKRLPPVYFEPESMLFECSYILGIFQPRVVIKRFFIYFKYREKSATNPRTGEFHNQSMIEQNNRAAKQKGEWH